MAIITWSSLVSKLCTVKYLEEKSVSFVRMLRACACKISILHKHILTLIHRHIHIMPYYLFTVVSVKTQLLYIRFIYTSESRLDTHSFVYLFFAGEMLYIPPQWSHYLHNSQPTISVSSWGKLIQKAPSSPVTLKAAAVNTL